MEFIMGPADAVSAIYAQILGSKPLTGDNAGLYGYRMFAFPFLKSLLDLSFSS